MGLGPLVGDTAEGGRDLVFVSYSHHDAEWAQRLRVLLKPLVRGKRLRLWDDTDIRGGDEWHPSIIRAIEQSSVALLLVSADFLNSDFIMERELPALIEQGVRLAPVLVGECLWQQVPELARVQWLRDPVRDGPLNLVVDQPGRRDGWLREICDRLITVVPVGRGAVGPEPPPVLVDDWLVAAVQAGPGRGELQGVPALPPCYLARDELAGVMDAVVAVEGGAVGLIGAVSAVGLHGQGGIGKSVLAAAVARDEGIRRRFPDGVYWVTLGDKADVLAVQLDLLARLGVRDQTPRTPVEALSHLRAVLENQRVLLVVDDVWSTAAALAFRATGPRGRVLYTSRDPQVLTAAGARLYPVDVLSPAVARTLAAAILEVTPGALPAAADQAFAAVGQVALAVALLAAAVRGGRSWDGVVGVLQRDAGIFGDHPYANTFKAMQIAVTALPVEVADALVSLAVFPPDTQIPVAAITRYWAQMRDRTAKQTAHDLDTLAAANVVRRDQDAVGFHDLQHDYLLLRAPMLALLHAGLLEAYRALLPTDERDQWWRLPRYEPYIGDHLIAHLCGAGEHHELAATVADPAYLAQRIATGGPYAAEADVNRAAVILPTHHLIGWWQSWIARHGHLLDHDDRAEAGSHAPAAAVAPTMLAWLTADGSLPQGVDPDRLAPLLPDSYLRVRWGLPAPDPALVRVLNVNGHTGSVFAVAWSPDGARLATAGGDGKVRVWDPITGHQLIALTGHTGKVLGVAWSPDGARLASAGGDDQVWVWDSVTGHRLATLTGHTGGVFAVAWSPDGTRLASAGGDGRVWVWEPDTGHLLAILRGHPAPAYLKLLSLLTSLPVQSPLTSIMVGNTGRVFAVAWSPDGTRLATAGIDGRVRLWDPVTGHQLATLNCSTNEVFEGVWSPDGTRLATAGGDEYVRVWDSTTDRGRSWRRSSSRHLSTLTGHTGGVFAVAWSPDGTRLASAGTDGRVRLWDLVTGHQLATLAGHTTVVTAVAWSPDGARLATASHDQVRVWNPDSCRQPTTLTSYPEVFDEVLAVAWSPDGTRLATASHLATLNELATAGTGGQVRVWDPITGHPLATLAGHTGPATRTGYIILAGLTALQGHLDLTVLIVLAAQAILAGRAIQALLTILATRKIREVFAVTWSSDGVRLAIDGIDRRVRVWDPAIGHQLATLTGHTSTVTAAAWSFDGARLATASDDGQVRVWDPLTGRRRSWHRSSPRHILILTGHTSAVTGVAWSPDGARLATASDDGQVRLWDPVTGHQLATFTGHTSAVTGVAWSPDGARLATVSDDGQVRLWDPVTGHQLAAFTGHTGGVFAVAWSPDGAHLATASRNGKIYVFPLDCPDQLTYLRVELLLCLQWGSAGIAIGGPHGVATLDLTCTGDLQCRVMSDNHVD